MLKLVACRFWHFHVLPAHFYVFNDLCDVVRDLAHPIKRLRPIPAGKVKKTVATMLALILVLLGFGIAAYAAPDILFNLMLYGGVTFLYSIWLKHIPIIDLFCISFGFLVRLDAGGQVFKVEVSHWLFITVLFLSLFLSTGKRIAEQNLLGGNATGHRTSLGDIRRGFLMQYFM
jgi:4-hydroxybenzoate polyprenyltransferase